MRPSTLSIPMEDWPEDIRDRFQPVWDAASESQRPRLRQGLGRWLQMSAQDDLPAEFITPALIAQRTVGMRPEIVAGMKQALQAVFADVPVFVKTCSTDVESPRAKLKREIERNWHRFPAPWQTAVGGQLYVSEDGLDDGFLVNVWALEGLRSKLQAVWAFFDFCAREGLTHDIIPSTVKARLVERQSSFQASEISLAYCLAELQRLQDFARAIFPDRDWQWFKAPIAMLKKKSSLEPSRNSGRLVDLAELKSAGETCSEIALLSHKQDSNHRRRGSALKLARTGLAISILVNSPVRLKCVANLDLNVHFDAGFTMMYLSAQETKDGKRDVRSLSPGLRAQILGYVEYHRRFFAPASETALFVGARGKPVGAGYLSQTIGDLTNKLFGKRVTAHTIRNIVASFIVSEAPEQSALAGEILNHSDNATTETYRSTADQIQAGNTLRIANDAGRANAGSATPEKPKTKRRPARRARVRHPAVKVARHA